MPDVGRLIYLFQTIRQLSLYILTLSYDFDTLPPSFKTNDIRTISVVTPGCKLRPDSYQDKLRGLWFCTRPFHDLGGFRSPPPSHDGDVGEDEQMWNSRSDQPKIQAQAFPRRHRSWEWKTPPTPLPTEFSNCRLSVATTSRFRMLRNCRAGWLFPCLSCPPGS